MADYTIEEQIVSYIARSFNPEDNFSVIAVSMSGNIGLALAKALYAPRLSLLGLTKGKYAILRNVRYPMPPGKIPEECIETLFSTEDIFPLIVRGKYMIIMQPLQIDQYGHMNLSLVGDKFRPTQSFVGSRNVPTNTANMPRTLYFVPNHLKRVFVEKVDFISGLGYGKERKEGIVKWGAPIEIVSNLGILDFEEETGKARLKSIHTGVTVDQVVENTGYDLIIPETLSETPSPNSEELQLLREVIDPLGVRRLDFATKKTFQKIVAEIQAGVVN